MLHILTVATGICALVVWCIAAHKSLLAMKHFPERRFWISLQNSFLMGIAFSVLCLVAALLIWLDRSTP